LTGVAPPKPETGQQITGYEWSWGPDGWATRKVFMSTHGRRANQEDAPAHSYAFEADASGAVITETASSE
jgi:hypothetical protein